MKKRNYSWGTKLKEAAWSTEGAMLKEYFRQFQGYAPETISTMSNEINRFLDYVCNRNGKAVADITEDDFYDYLEVRLSGDFGAARQEKVFLTVRRYVRFLKEHGAIKTSFEPEKLPVPRFKHTVIKEKVVLEKDELKLLLDRVREESFQSVEGLMFYTILSIELTTGLRHEALLATDMEDVDMKTGVLMAREKNNVLREFKLSPDVRNTLERWTKQRSFLPGAYHQDALFIQPCNSHRVSKNWTNQVLKSLSKEITGKEVTMHRLRASVATVLYEDTRDLFLVQRLLGHKSAATTQLYIANTQRTVDRGTDHLAAMFFED